MTGHSADKKMRNESAIQRIKRIRDAGLCQSSLLNGRDASSSPPLCANLQKKEEKIKYSDSVGLLLLDSFISLNCFINLTESVRYELHMILLTAVSNHVEGRQTTYFRHSVYNQLF